MTKKKTTPPVKKAAPKKKVVDKKPEAKWVTGIDLLKTDQPPYMKAFIKKYGNIMPDDLGLGVMAHPPAEETRIGELEAENYALKQLLSKQKQSEDMTQGIKAAAPIASATILDSLLNEMDKNLSRFYNAMNTLDAFADRLKPSDQGQMPVGSLPPPPPSVVSRMERLLSDFNHLNSRLEATNNYLSEII